MCAVYAQLVLAPHLFYLKVNSIDQAVVPACLYWSLYKESILQISNALVFHNNYNFSEKYDQQLSEFDCKVYLSKVYVLKVYF